MVLEELFKHFQYASYKKLEGVGIFDKDKSNQIKFYYSWNETLFTDGEIIHDDSTIGERIIENPTYCISATNYDHSICSNPRQIHFEVFIGNDDEQTIKRATQRLSELSNEVHLRIKRSMEEINRKNRWRK